MPDDNPPEKKRGPGRPPGTKNKPDAGKNGNPVGRPRKNGKFCKFSPKMYLTNLFSSSALVNPPSQSKSRSKKQKSDAGGFYLILL
jgi:hypothetical protein